MSADLPNRVFIRERDQNAALFSTFCKLKLRTCMHDHIQNCTTHNRLCEDSWRPQPQGLWANLGIPTPRGNVGEYNPILWSMVENPIATNRFYLVFQLKSSPISVLKNKLAIIKIYPKFIARAVWFEWFDWIDLLRYALNLQLSMTTTWVQMLDKNALRERRVHHHQFTNKSCFFFFCVREKSVAIEFTMDGQIT